MSARAAGGASDLRLSLVPGLLAGLALALVLAATSPGTSSAQAAIVAVSEMSGFNAPLFVVQPPDGSNRLFVLEQSGAVKVIDAGAPSTFLDLTAQVSTGGERGLLRLALHPSLAGQ